VGENPASFEGFFPLGIAGVSKVCRVAFALFFFQMNQRVYVLAYIPVVHI
jgi:hypothetical protein